MQTKIAAFLVVFLVLLAGWLELRWTPKEIDRVVEVPSHYHPSLSTNVVLSMPCTWISKTGPLEPLKPRCTNAADLTNRSK